MLHKTKFNTTRAKLILCFKNLENVKVNPIKVKIELRCYPNKIFIISSIYNHNKRVKDTLRIPHKARSGCRVFLFPKRYGQIKGRSGWRIFLFPEKYEQIIPVPPRRE